jgi:hypothetical protein
LALLSKAEIKMPKQTKKPPASWFRAQYKKRNTKRQFRKALGLDADSIFLKRHQYDKDGKRKESIVKKLYKRAQAERIAYNAKRSKFARKIKRRKPKHKIPAWGAYKDGKLVEEGWGRVRYPNSDDEGTDTEEVSPAMVKKRNKKSKIAKNNRVFGVWVENPSGFYTTSRGKKVAY